MKNEEGEYMVSHAPSAQKEDGFAEAKHVLVHLAVGLLRQNEVAGRGLARPVTDLDEQLQWGWDKLAAFCYKYHVSPPRHLPEFVAWLHRPIESWEGIGHLFASALLSGSLLTYGAPSEFCADLGRGLHLSSNP